MVFRFRFLRRLRRGRRGKSKAEQASDGCSSHTLSLDQAEQQKQTKQQQDQACLEGRCATAECSGEASQSSEGRELCSICLDYLEIPTRIEPCKHVFCGKCLTQYWLHRMRQVLFSFSALGTSLPCPICRGTAERLHVLPFKEVAEGEASSKCTSSSSSGWRGLIPSAPTANALLVAFHVRLYNALYTLGKQIPLRLRTHSVPVFYFVQVFAVFMAMFYTLLNFVNVLEDVLPNLWMYRSFWLYWNMIFWLLCGIASALCSLPGPFGPLNSNHHHGGGTAARHRPRLQGIGALLHNHNQAGVGGDTRSSPGNETRREGGGGGLWGMIRRRRRRRQALPLEEDAVEEEMMNNLFNMDLLHFGIHFEAFPPSFHVPGTGMSFGFGM